MDGGNKEGQSEGSRSQSNSDTSIASLNDKSSSSSGNKRGAGALGTGQNDEDPKDGSSNYSQIFGPCSSEASKPKQKQVEPECDDKDHKTQKCLKEWEQRLAEREKELDKQKEILDRRESSLKQRESEFDAKVSSNPENDNDLVILDVSGRKYPLTWSLLRKYPDSFLGSMFSKENKALRKQQSDGSYPIGLPDHLDKDAFMYVIMFLWDSPTAHLSLRIVADNLLDTIKELANYLCLDELEKIVDDVRNPTYVVFNDRFFNEDPDNPNTMLA